MTRPLCHSSHCHSSRCRASLRRWSLVRHAVVAVALVAVPACNAVLAIEERTFEPCQTYCDTLDTACTGNLQQYQNKDTCLKACALIEPGDFDAPTGDTLACRVKNAELAVNGDKQKLCTLAGFAGVAAGGVTDCVTDRCKTYCGFMTEVCAGVSTIGNDFEECLSSCGRTPDNPAWGPEDVNVKDHDNSIQCRIWHLSVATTADSHCAHAEGVVKCDGVIP